jgi:hypothetical protein
VIAHGDMTRCVALKAKQSISTTKLRVCVHDEARTISVIKSQDGKLMGADRLRRRHRAGSDLADLAKTGCKAMMERKSDVVTGLKK